CLKEKSWTWRDARFLHMGTSMSDGTADPLRYDDESRTSSRPSTRRTKTVLLPFPLLGLRLNHDGPIVHDCGRFGLIAVEVEGAKSAGASRVFVWTSPPLPLPRPRLR